MRPNPLPLRGVYFHGTQEPRVVKAVMRGRVPELRPASDVPQTRYLVGDPLYPKYDSRVYLTSNWEHALRYAQLDESKPGAIYQVSVAGSVVVVDEDRVGEAILYAFGMDERYLGGWDVIDVMDDDDLLLKIRRQTLSGSDWTRSELEDLAFFSPGVERIAALGKECDWLSREVLQRLVDHGADIAVSPQDIEVEGVEVIDAGERFRRYSKGSR